MYVLKIPNIVAMYNETIQKNDVSLSMSKLTENGFFPI